MEIKFDFSDEIYAEKLIKRLLETTSGLSVADALSDDYDVLLTDRYQHVADERTVYLSDLLTDPVSIYSSTDAIRDYAVSVYEKNSGKLLRTVKRKKRTVSFYSEFGGSGCTSVALTYSRCLALNEKKTVFITKGNSYISEEKKRRAKSLKLNYLLHLGKGERITSFMEEDMYGLYVIYVADFSQIEKLAASLGSLNEFDWIVIDYGTVRPVTGDLKLCVTNSHDMRYRITEIKDEPVIENYSRNKGIFCIPEDCDAFMVSGRHVDIMLDTEFGRAVSRIAKETADE